MKKFTLLIITIITTLFFLSMFTDYTQAAIQNEGKNYLIGDGFLNPKLEKINSNDEFLFVSSSNGISLLNIEQFKVEKSINITGIVIDYFIIDNIEDEDRPNKDIIIFTKDQSLPSVIAYSLDTLEPIWSFMSTYSGFNELGIPVTNKMPVFDYDVQDFNFYFVAGYSLYNLNLIDGQLKWKYSYNENIWSVCSVNDITSDGVHDVVISVQPTQVIAIDGELGVEIWKESVAKQYEVKEDNKVIGNVQRNVWDLHFNDDLVYATSEDGYIYQLNAQNGSIMNSVQVIENIPQMLADSVYVQNNKPIKYSGLGLNKTNAYKMIHTRLLSDITNDGFDDFLVTVFEDNPYSTYTGFTPQLLLIDGHSLAVLSERELILNRKIIDLKISDDHQLSYFDSKQYEVINLSEKDLNLVTEIDLSEYTDIIDQEGLSYSSFLDGNTFYLQAESLYQIDISNPSSPLLQNTIYFINQYDTIFSEQYIYKLYYIKDSNDHKKNNYYVIQCMDIKTQLIIWEHALDDLDFAEQKGFNNYVIYQLDQLHEKFLYINKQGELVVLDYEDELNVSIINHDFLLSKDIGIIQFSEYQDLNGDGHLEYMIVTRLGDLVILNGTDLSDVLFHKYLNNNYYHEDTTIANKMYDLAIPNYDADEHVIFLINNQSINRVTLNENFEITLEEEIELGNFNFWYDPTNVLHQYDYDGDEINDYVIRLNNTLGENEQKIAILYSNSKNVGFVNAGWDFSLYPAKEDLDDDGVFDVMLVTGGSDKDDNWYQRASLLSPSLQPTINELIIFERLFYDGNSFTMNSKYKPLQIINDINGDGKKDVAVLIDRWGQSYIQMFDIKDPEEVLDILPLRVQNIDKETMFNSQLGAPGGVIDIIKTNEKDYLILSIVDEFQDFSTSLYNLPLGQLKDIQELVKMNTSIYQYEIVNDVFINTTFASGNRNDNRFYVHLNNFNTHYQIQNINNGDVFSKSPINIEWSSNVNEIMNPLYKVYLNGQLVAMTEEQKANLFLIDGENNIGIGVMLTDGTEVITNTTVTLDLDNSKLSYLYYYISAALLVVFITPLKFRRYKKMGVRK